jgi:hypothetical protein
MKTKRPTVLVAALMMIAASSVMMRASDPTAVYAKVDRVVLEPNAEAPDTIQIWGVFSMAQPNNRNDYQPAARGYLYFALPANKEVARREWSDLKSVAGTGQIVAFGSRFGGTARLRQPADQPGSPDAYAINMGVTKVQGRTDYAPIRALVDFKP